MKLHKKLVLLVGLGMLFIMSITIIPIHFITTIGFGTSEHIGMVSVELREIMAVERSIDEMLHAIQAYIMSGDDKYRKEYKRSLTGVKQSISTIGDNDIGQSQRAILASMSVDLERMSEKANDIFSTRIARGGQARQAADLLTELNSLHLWMERDIRKFEEASTAEMVHLLGRLRTARNRMTAVLVSIFLATIVLLTVFVGYIRRAVTVPLSELWEGTEEISRGNLDYRMRETGESDISLLVARFNDMAGKLRSSYADLEQKLNDRMHELASLDAVALTLSHAGSLKDVLDKSLLRILDSLSGTDPRGGIFLSEPGGETLRLMSHKGLSPEFAQRESTIRMGECLCGQVAQTGDLLLSESCKDPLHTRAEGEEAHSHIIFPIKSRGIVLGVVFLYPQKDFKLKPSDVQMLDAIGSQLGMAVENFRFYAEVKESSEKYWDLFENGTDILCTLDDEGRLTAVNKAAEAFSGYSKVDLTGKSVFDFLAPAAKDRARSMFVSRFNRSWTELEVTKRDGTRAFIEVSVRRLSRKRQPSGYQVSARDVTEQKRLRELLVQGERLGAIGQVGIAVRHEINNPLTTVIGNIELLIERYQDRDKDLTARLETVLNNSLRIAEIVKQLQAIKKDRVVEYVKGIKMTDLKQK